MKKMLLVEWPPMSMDSTEAIFFRHVGFSVEEHQSRELENMAAKVAEFDLANYDVITINIQLLMIYCLLNYTRS